MNKRMKKMTVEQKQIYYVTKISRLSSEEYKLKAGKWIGFGLCIINEMNYLGNGIPIQIFSQAVSYTSAAISAYCMIAQEINSKQQSEAYHELAILNTKLNNKVKRLNKIKIKRW